MMNPKGRSSANSTRSQLALLSLGLCNHCCQATLCTSLVARSRAASSIITSDEKLVCTVHTHRSLASSRLLSCTRIESRRLLSMMSKHALSLCCFFAPPRAHVA